jgi:hypothetical protein
MALEGIESSGGRGNYGNALLLSAGVVYEIIAAACSSPQTTELNAAARSKTLMKWVHLGMIQAMFFVLLAAFIEPRKAWAYITGGGLAAGLLYWQYDYAKKCGLKSNEPPTENYDVKSPSAGNYHVSGNRSNR